MNSLKQPSGRVLTSIGEILNVVRGGSPRPKGDPRYFGGKIPWIMIADVTSEKGKFISKTRDSVTEEGAEKSRLLPKGTLILTNSATVCVPKILAVDGCIHDGFVAFPEFSKSLEILYIYYYFDYIRPQIIQQNRQGITQVNLNIDIVKNIPIQLPPLYEQRRIVTKIEELFTQLDAGVASLKKVQAQLKRYRQAVLKAAFEGRLTQEWRKEHKGEIEPAEKLLDKIIEQQKSQKKKNPKTNYSVIPPQQLPDKWIWCSSNDIFEFVTSGSRWWAKYYSDEGALFIRIGNLTRDSISLILDNVQKVTPQDVAEMKRTRLLENDILVSITADLGSIGLIPQGIGEAYINQHIALCRPVNRMNPKFIAWYFRSESGGNKQLLSFQRGATKKGLGLDDIKSVNIPLCSFKEQDLVVSEIEHHFSLIDHLENTITTSLRQAETLRQSILKRAFEGKLVPQNPNDEPASILLERIKAEKAHHTTETKKGKTLQPKSPKRKLQNAN